MKLLRFALLSSIICLITSVSLSNPKTKTIDITISDCTVGNHMTSIDSNYKGHNIEISLYYDGSTKVIMGNKYVDDWSEKMRPNDGSEVSPLKGKHAKIKGRWINKSTFEASEVIVK
jgi:hypothetical protein